MHGREGKAIHACHGRSQSRPIGIAPNQEPVTAPMAGYTRARSTGVRGLRGHAGVSQDNGYGETETTYESSAKRRTHVNLDTSEGLSEPKAGGPRVYAGGNTVKRDRSRLIA